MVELPGGPPPIKKRDSWEEVPLEKSKETKAAKVKKREAAVLKARIGANILTMPAQIGGIAGMSFLGLTLIGPAMALANAFRANKSAAGGYLEGVVLAGKIGAAFVGGLLAPLTYIGYRLAKRAEKIDVGHERQWRPTGLYFPEERKAQTKEAIIHGFALYSSARDSLKEAAKTLHESKKNYEIF